MQKVEKKKLFRIVDANLNRAKEGLRVCEDICRFVLNEKSFTRKFKNLRHKLTEAVVLLKIKDIIASRDIIKDVGKISTESELRRSEMRDIFYANLQRVKESVRVLEEVSKLIDKSLAQKLKELRYKVYDVEKAIIEKI